MKKIRFFLMTMVFGLSMFTTIAHAGPPVFFSWGGEKIVMVMPLPNMQEFQLKTGEHVDIGYRFSQITIFFIPVWNYEEHWCGYIGTDKRYMDYDKATLDDAARSASLTIPTGSPIPFWDAYGGKLVFAILVLLSLTYKKLNPFKKHDASTPSASPKNSNTTGVIGSTIENNTESPQVSLATPSFETQAAKDTHKDFQNTAPNKHTLTVTDDVLNDIFTKVAGEISDRIIDPGLMARADVEANGDDAAKMRIYTKYRVKQCMDAYVRQAAG